jgi:hypothetical protein
MSQSFKEYILPLYGPAGMWIAAFRNIEAYEGLLLVDPSDLGHFSNVLEGKHTISRQRKDNIVRVVNTVWDVGLQNLVRPFTAVIAVMSIIYSSSCGARRPSFYSPYPQCIRRS